MGLRVNLYLGDRYISPDEYENIVICCPTVNKIVNRIYEINHRKDSETDPESDDE